MLGVSLMYCFLTTPKRKDFFGWQRLHLISSSQALISSYHVTSQSIFFHFPPSFCKTSPLVTSHHLPPYSSLLLPSLPLYPPSFSPSLPPSPLFSSAQLPVELDRLQEQADGSVIRSASLRSLPTSPG